MRRQSRLSKKQFLYILVSWVLLCVSLFIINDSKPLSQNIIYAIIAGVLICVGVVSGNKKTDKHNRR